MSERRTGAPRRFHVRITNPQRNSFLLAPLAKAAGGTGACGKPIFATTAAPDYEAILATFHPIEALMKARPRMDTPGARDPGASGPAAPQSVSPELLTLGLDMPWKW